MSWATIHLCATFTTWVLTGDRKRCKKSHSVIRRTQKKQKCVRVPVRRVTVPFLLESRCVSWREKLKNKKIERASNLRESDSSLLHPIMMRE